MRIKARRLITFQFLLIPNKARFQAFENKHLSTGARAAIPHSCHSNE